MGRVSLLPPLGADLGHPQHGAPVRAHRRPPEARAAREESPVDAARSASRVLRGYAGRFLLL